MKTRPEPQKKPARTLFVFALGGFAMLSKDACICGGSHRQYVEPPPMASSAPSAEPAK